MARAHPLPIVLLMALSLALSLAPAPDAAALPRQKDRWIQVDTGNFTIFSNASPAAAKSVGEDLEQFRAVLARLTAGEVNAPIPTLIYVFSGERTFRPYKPIRDGKPADLGSLFQPRRHANYISINAALRSARSKSVYTMYAFEFLHNNLPNLPMWLDRGLAEYYGTLEIEKQHTNIGKPDSGHLRRLRDHPVIRLEELFATEQHPGYRSGEPAYRFDAQCWVVVHYLLTTEGERLQQTGVFLEELKSGAPQRAAFERAFKTTYAGMEQELKSYVRQFTFGYRRFDLARIGGEETKVEPMAYPEVLYRLGDLLANQQKPRPEAAEHFQAALKADPGHARALAGLGQVAAREERHAAALEHYRQAAARAPDDFLIQYRYADGLLRGRDRSRAAEAQQALERSVAANPGFAPAWAKLAYAYAFEDDPSPRAVAAAETAHKLLPSRKSVAENLLLLYSKAGLREPAQALVDRFFVSRATAAELVEARSRLAYLDLEAAYDLLRDGEIDTARDILERLEPLAAAGEVSPRSADQIRRLGEDLERRRLSDQYNEAVDRFNVGEFAKVCDLLEEVLVSSAVEAGLKTAAQELCAAAKEQLGGG